MEKVATGSYFGKLERNPAKWEPVRRKIARQTNNSSAPLPKFVIHRGTLSHELRKQRGTGKVMIRVPLFDLKFLKRDCRMGCRNFKSAALVPRFRSS